MDDPDHNSMVVGVEFICHVDCGSALSLFEQLFFA